MTTLNWFPSQTAAPPNGVALVIHGLNVRPDRMQPLIDCLNEAGIDCLSLALHGHGDNYLHQPHTDPQEARLESFRRVTTGLWRDEVVAAYRIARARADAQQLPIYFCGYSLGALMGCTAVATVQNVYFDRMLLFAPAIALPVDALALRMGKLLRSTTMPSLSPTYYRANSGSPGAAYLAMYTAVVWLNQGDWTRLHVPTLVFVDAEDEAIDVPGVEAVIDRTPRWQLVPVHKSAPAAGWVFHHLVIGAPAVGVDCWTAMRHRIQSFVHT